MEYKSRKKRNNVGMSLVEIIVVVLIMGILSAGTIAGFAMMRSMDASSAAEEIYSLLERTKMNTLSAEETANIRLVIKQEDKHYYGIILKGTGTEVEKVEIGNSALTIKVKNQDSSVTQISSSDSCEFTYNKSNGAFTSTYNEIQVEGTKTVSLKLVTATGRSYIGN